MHFAEILLDNRISCNFVDTEGAENVIFCRPLEESLDNVATITTRDNEFIHNFITESNGDTYLITDVKLSDGEIFNNVRFKLITCEAAELPYSTINTAAFDIPSDFEVITSTKKHLNEEVLIHNFPAEVETTEYPEYIRGSFDPIIIEQAQNLQAQLTKQQKEIQQQEEQLRRRQAAVELNERIQKTLENYKSELLSEYYNTQEKQKDILSSQLNDVSTSLFKYLGEKLKDQKNSSAELLAELSENKFKQLQLEHEQSIVKIKSEIDGLLAEKIKDNSSNINQLLVERSGELQKLFSEKIVLELEDYKHQIEEEIESINFTIDGLVEEKLQAITEETDKRLINRADELKTRFSEQLDEQKSELVDEFKSTSSKITSEFFIEKSEELNNALAALLNEQKAKLDNSVTEKITEISNTINTFKTDIDGRVPKLDKKIADINSKINQLVQEKRNVQNLVDSAKQYTDTKVAQASEDAINYARRILELGSGGGSVAVQYANGGTMDGSLNVTGQYLSGGVDIATLFSQGGGGGDPAVNSLVHTNSGLWNSAYNTSTAYQAVSSSFVTGDYVSSNFLNLTGGTITGAISASNGLSAANIVLTNAAVQTFANPVTASGTFLILNINGSNQALQLWNYTS